MSNVEHLFIYLLTICMSSLEKHFLIGLVIFLVLSCLYILGIKALSVALFANIFSHSMGCLFISFMASIDVLKFLSLIMSHLFFVFI